MQTDPQPETRRETPILPMTPEERQALEAQLTPEYMAKNRHLTSRNIPAPIDPPLAPDPQQVK